MTHSVLPATAKSTDLAPETMQEALDAAAARATLAPSVHNSQPWRFVVRDDRLDLYADRDRAVPVIDPLGRQAAISCGAALFGLRVALAAAGMDAVTALLPDPADPDLLAGVTVIGMSPAVDTDARRLDAAADRRHSNRRRFGTDPVPRSVIDSLMHAAAVEGAWLHPIRQPDDRVAVAVLSQHADALENADPAYRAELRAWTSSDPERLDGVPETAVPHTTGQSHDDVPIRDFDTDGSGGLPSETRSRLSQQMVLVCTEEDDLRGWLVAGQALGRVLLELTSMGYVASILSQVVEVGTARDQLRRELRLVGHAQVLLRVGTAEITPASPRRPAEDVITTELTGSPQRLPSRPTPL